MGPDNLPDSQGIHEEEEEAPIKAEYSPARQDVQDDAAAEAAYEAALHNSQPASRAVRAEGTQDPEQDSCHPEAGTSFMELEMYARHVLLDVDPKEVPMIQYA